MVEVDKFYEFKHNPEYTIYVHAVFYTNAHGLRYMAYEDWEGQIFTEEVVNFEFNWTETRGY